MIRHFSASVAAFFGAAIIAALSSLGVNAQPIGWTPPCNTTRAFNATACTANLRLRTIPAGAIAPVAVPPGATVGIPVPPGVTITAVFSQASTAVPIVSPGPVMPPPAPPVAATGWVQGIRLAPSGCCFDIYFDQSTAPDCVIWLLPAAGPPPCTP